MRLTLGLAVLGLILMVSVVGAEPAWEVYLSKTQDMDLIETREPIPIRNTVFVPMEDIAIAAGASLEVDADRCRIVVLKGDHARNVPVNFSDDGARKVNDEWYCSHDVMADVLFGASYFSRGQSEINMVIDVEGD